MSRLIPVDKLIMHYRRLEVATGDEPRVGDFSKQARNPLALKTDPNAQVQENETRAADYWHIDGDPLAHDEETETQF